MSVSKKRAYSRYTQDAITLLGKHIQLERKRLRFTKQDFADRMGISRTTLQKLEKGDLKCEIGIVFEAATLVGMNLFDIEPRGSFAAKLEQANDKLTLLPKSIRKRTRKVDDDF